MPSPTRTIETDVCVVGAGLIGLAHALEARRRGLSVVLLDRGARAAGASVRHSGHLFFSALKAGPALDLAPLARERWLELAQRAGTAADQGGTLIVARSRAELAALEAVAAEPGRQARMRSAKKLGRMAPIPVGEVVGALHAKADLRIAPRSAPAALARLLRSDPCARIEWGSHVHEIEPGLVHAGHLRVRAEAVVVCPGTEYRMLPAGLRPPCAELKLRETQMLRLGAPSGRRYRQTLTTALSLLEHPGFGAYEETAQLRTRLELEAPHLIERGVSLGVTQLANGDLIVGSTSTYVSTPSPYSREPLDELLLGEAQRLLGARPRVKQRWRNLRVVLTSSSDDFLTTGPMPGVRVVLGLQATALALCHAHASTVMAELTDDRLGKPGYITVRDLRSGESTAGGLRDHAGGFSARRAPRS